VICIHPFSFGEVKYFKGVDYKTIPKGYAYRFAPEKVEVEKAAEKVETASVKRGEKRKRK